MNKALKVGLIGLAALLALGVAALLLIDTEQLRPTLEAQLQKALARPVKLGRLSISWYPLGVRAGSVEIGEDPRFGTRPFAIAKELRASAKILPLLSRRVEIQSVEIIEPQVELIRRNGVWNYESLGGPKSEPGSSSATVELGGIEIHDGQAAVTLDAEPRVVYPKTNFSLSNIGPGSATFKMTASGTAGNLSGNLNADGEMKNGALKGALSIRDARLKKASLGDLTAKVDLTRSGTNTDLHSFELLLGKLAFRGKGTVRGEQLALDVEVPRSPVADLVQLAAAFGEGLPPGMKADGQMDAKLQVHGTTSEPKVTGRINAGDLHLSGGAVKQEVRSRALAVDLLPEAIRSSPFEITCGNTKLSGSFSVRDYSSARPLLESAVMTQNSDIADLLQIAQAYGAADASLKATGKATVNLRVHGPLTKGTPFQLAGKGSLDGVTLQTAKFDHADVSFPSSNTGTVAINRLEYEKVVLTSLRANATFRSGVLRLEPLTANLYGGAATGTITVDTRGKNNVIALQTHVDKVESSQLMSAISALPQLISGPLSADINLNVAPQGNEDPLRAMSGNVALKFAGGKLHTMNLLGELNTVARFVGGPKLTEKYTSFLGMQGELKLDKGVAQTNGLKFNLSDATATFTGTMNFVDQTLNMKLMSVLAPKLAEAVGGSRIGGYLTAAIRNANGELIIPTLVTGSLNSPRLTPDAPAIAKLQLQNTVPNVVDVLKGAGKGQTGGSGQDVLKDVLGGILGGGKKKQQ
jgi:AsmA protein